MIRRSRRHDAPGRPAAGFALVVTLIMAVLAAVMVVALLTNATLDRTTATSYSNRFNAELAVQNGLEDAKHRLNPGPIGGTAAITSDDAFLVTRVDGPVMPIVPAPAAAPTPAYYYIARPQPGTPATMNYYPLFSGGRPVIGLPIDLTAPAPVATPTPPPNPQPGDSSAAIQTDSGKTKITKAYPELAPWLSPASTNWTEVADPSDTGGPGSYTLPYQRYSFWVEDLGGYVDSSIAGNTADAGGKNKRPLDQSSTLQRYVSAPGEIALFTLFDSASATDSGTTGAELLVGNRPLQLTTASTKQVAPALANPDVLSPNIAVGLVPDSEQALVPLGYGYADGGNPAKPRVDLAAEVQRGGDPAVQTIAAKINANLPSFGSVRKGGLVGTDYVKNISASIVDYADADSDATVDATPNTGYRGIDSYPFVNEIYTMKWWKRTYQANGTYWVEIQMDTWVELWNPCNQTISGTAAIDVIENHPVQAGLYSYTFGTTAADLQNGSTVVSTPSGVATIPISGMQPNEYTAYKLRTDTFQYNTGIAPPLIFPATGTTTMPLTATLLSNYKLSWNGKLVDTAGSDPAQHVLRSSGSLKGPPNYIASNKNWRGTYPGFGYATSPSSLFTQYDTMGDPRSAFSIASSQFPIAYDQGSSFWFRNKRTNIAAQQIYAEQRPASWPDSGHDATSAPLPPGNGQTTDPPTTRPGGAVTESTKAPATIANRPYATTAELANIYDPGLWNIPPDTSSPPRWSNMQVSDITAASQANANYGGGMTLHIGRPEFTLFDKPGTRAWQLLDLFHTGSRVNTLGLVNINTASREALRALGANVLLNRDANVVPVGSLYPPYTTKQADRFADAVIAARPFLSPAQLSGMKILGTTPLRPFFGNTAAWSGGPQTAPTEWNDSGTEEYFAKVFPLATVRSRNFRIFVTGQSLDKNNKVLSTVSKVFQVHLRPTRDAAGRVTAQSVVTTYETHLPL